MERDIYVYVYAIRCRYREFIREKFAVISMCIYGCVWGIIENRENLSVRIIWIVGIIFHELVRTWLFFFFFSFTILEYLQFCGLSIILEFLQFTVRIFYRLLFYLIDVRILHLFCIRISRYECTMNNRYIWK